VARFLLVLFSFIVFLSPVTSAKDVYYIGFLGNSNNASAQALYNTLSLTCEAMNNTANPYEVAPVFFNEDSGPADEINGKGDLLAVLGCFSEKHSAILGKVNNTPLINVCKSYPGFIDKEKTNLFRVCPAEAKLASDLARFAYSVLEKDRMAVVYTEGNEEYKQAAGAFAETMRRNRIPADYVKSVAADRTDFTNVILRVRDMKKQIVYFAGPTEQAVELAKETVAMNTGANFIGMSDIGNKAFLKKAKIGTQSACFASVVPSSLYNLKKFVPFLTMYDKRFTGQDMYMPFVYDAAMMAASCLEAGKKSGPDISACLKSINYSGITGDISFAADGDRKRSETFFYVMYRKEILPRRISEAEMKKFETMK
jgi:ABC-type branched-subunit amino acid transport system substrate-binding protein